MSNRSTLRARSLTRPAVAVLSLALAGGALAACGGDKKPAAGPSASPSASVPNPTPTPKPVSPFTGESAIGEAVLAVKIDNTRSALPHIGLREADLVYVQQVEGGITRLAAIYASELPDTIAPMRSARETDVQLLRQFGKIPIAFSGSVASVHRQIQGAGFVDVSADLGGEGYSFLPGRYMPYNTAGDPEVLLDRSDRKVAPKAVGLTFGAEAPAGGRAADAVAVRFPMGRIGFTYKPATGQWRYTLDGRVDQVPGKSAQAASTIVVQQVSITSTGRRDTSGSPVPFTRTVGSGKGWALRDGKAYRITWSRAYASSPTRYLFQGKDFPMKAGQPWIVLAPKGGSVAFSDRRRRGQPRISARS